MPITYTGATGLFTHLGKIIARLNSYTSFASSTLATDAVTLFSSFSTVWLPTEGVASYYAGFQDEIAARKRGVARFADSRLLDAATVLSQFSAPLPSVATVQQVLPALQRQMILDSRTVKACAVTVTNPAGLATNYGDGLAFSTRILDGYSPPLAGAQASPFYGGVASQLAVPSEVITLECVQDSSASGARPGFESWQISGATSYQPLDWRSEGSGVGPVVYTDNGSSASVTNGDWSSWSGGSPSGWSLESGTVSQEESADAYFANGSAAVAEGDFVLSQDVAPSINARRRYCVTVAAMARGGLSGTLRVGFLNSPSGHTDFPLSSLTGSYRVLQFHVAAPAIVPAPYRFGVQATGLSGGPLLLGPVTLAPVTYHGGVGVNVVSGRSPWQRGDRIAFSVTNDQAGKFQTFFRQWYGFQLPSAASGVSQGTALTSPFLQLFSTGAESISDSLVV